MASSASPMTMLMLRQYKIRHLVTERMDRAVNQEVLFLYFA